MESRAPVSRIERAAKRVFGGTEGDGISELCWRRASLARDSCGRVEAGSAWWWRACWRECRMWSSEGVEVAWWEEVADGIFSPWFVCSRYSAAY